MQNVSRVVIERQAPGDEPRVGRVIGGAKGVLEVEWANGSRDKVRLGEEFIATVEGSLAHLARGHPATAEALAETDPGLIVAHALTDGPKPTGGLKKSLTELGFPPQLAETIVSRGLPQLVERHWVKTGRSGTGHVLDRNVILPTLPIPRPWDAAAPLPSDNAAERTEEGAPLRTTPTTDAAPTNGGRSPLDDPYAEIAGAVEKPEDSRVLEWLTTTAAVGVAVQLVRHDDRDKQARGSRILRRWLESAENRRFDLVLGSLLALAERKAKISVEVGTQLANSLAASIRTAPPSERGTIAEVGKAVGWLPWSAKGGKAAVLAALSGASKEELDPSWWKGVGWAELRLLASGVAQSALARPEVRDKVVRPTVLRRLEDLQTRSDLAEVLGAPRVLLEAVPEGAVLEASLRVESQDTLWRRFMDLTRRREELDSTKRLLEETQESVRKLLADAATSAARLESSERRRMEVESLLNGAREDDRVTRGAELRQARMDGLRALARVGALVAAEPAVPAALLPRVDALLEREGLDRIGSTGERMQFDPSRCESPAGDLERGVDVDVVRPGYQLVQGDETIVLVRALVKPDSHPKG